MDYAKPHKKDLLRPPSSGRIRRWFWEICQGLGLGVLIGELIKIVAYLF